MKHIRPVSKGQDMRPEEILTLVISLVGALVPIITILLERKEAETPEAESRMG